MKKLLLFQFTFLFAFFSYSQNTQYNYTGNRPKEIYIPYSSMTISYNGRKQTKNQSGKIIFEKERIIMQGGSSKESFYIKKILESDNIITFKTKNNKNEEVNFYIEFVNGKVSKINFNMFGMEGNFKIFTGTANYSNIKKMFNKGTLDCNCNVIHRADGANINNCDPLPVASDKNLEVGLSLMSANNKIYGAMAIRFFSKLQELRKNINIVLKDGYHINAIIINQKKTIIGNSKVLLVIYKFSEKDIIELQKSEISVISFELQDKFLRSFEVRTNEDVFIKQYNCLKS